MASVWCGFGSVGLSIFPWIKPPWASKFGGAHGLMWQIGLVSWWWIGVVPRFVDRADVVLAVTKHILFPLYLSLTPFFSFSLPLNQASVGLMGWWSTWVWYGGRYGRLGRCWGGVSMGGGCVVDGGLGWWCCWWWTDGWWLESFGWIGGWLCCWWLGWFGFGRWMYCLGFGMNFCAGFVWGLG